MEGEMSVESAKTVNKTSGVLNCLVDYEEHNIKYALQDSIRRCIVYSLYKHLDIGWKVLKFLEKYLSQDLLINIMTELRRMFGESDPRYLLNTIYLDDFCIYLLT